MIIRAIRLKEVGIFSTPVVLENLSGGLDVLAEPNESGKSTLFKALQALFFEKFSSGKKPIRALRSNSGGVPLIEVDFDCDGVTWRLRKQFLTSKHAVLIRRDTGKVEARDADAEDALSALLQDGEGGGPARFGLLWVGQKASLEPVTPDHAQGGALQDAVAQEVAMVTGGRQNRVIRKRALAEREALVTAKQNAPRGDYKHALQARDGVVEELKVAREKAEQAAARLEALAIAQKRLEQLQDPEHSAERAKALSDAHKAVADGEAAREKFTIAEQVLADKRLVHEAAGRDLAAFERDLAEAKTLKKTLKTLEREKSKQGKAVDKARQAVKDLRHKRVEVVAQEDKCRRHLQVLKQRQALLVLTAKRDRQKDRLDRAKAAHDRVVQLQRQLEGNPATPERLGRLHQEDRDIALLEGRLTAAAPRVRVTYRKGKEGTVLVDGKPVKSGKDVVVQDTTTFQLADLGHLVVEAGAVQERDEDLRDLQAHRETANTLMSEMAVKDRAEAARLARDRERTERDLQGARAQFAAFAEGG